MVLGYLGKGMEPTSKDRGLDLEAMMQRQFLATKPCLIPKLLMMLSLQLRIKKALKPAFRMKKRLNPTIYPTYYDFDIPFPALEYTMSGKQRI